MENIPVFLQKYFREVISHPDGAIVHDGDCGCYRPHGICTCGLLNLLMQMNWDEAQKYYPNAIKELGIFNALQWLYDMSTRENKEIKKIQQVGSEDLQDPQTIHNRQQKAADLIYSAWGHPTLDAIRVGNQRQQVEITIIPPDWFSKKKELQYKASWDDKDTHAAYNDIIEQLKAIYNDLDLDQNIEYIVRVEYIVHSDDEKYRLMFISGNIIEVDKNHTPAVLNHIQSIANIALNRLVPQE
jgi:hypothetical protein